MRKVKPQLSPGLKFIYWFAYYNLSSPSVRYRGSYPLQYLRREFGIKNYFVIPDYAPARVVLFFRAFFSALFFRKAGSLIVIQRIHSGFIYSTLLKLLVKFRNANTFYDLDDADYLEHPPGTIYYFIRNCSGLIAGSTELAKNLKGIAGKIILNTSPTPAALAVKGNKNSLLTIGWIGDFRGGHKESMQNLFFPALATLPFKIKLVLMGVTQEMEYEFLSVFFRQYENVQLEMPQNIDWNDERIIQEKIATFDIGIATLLDSELQRSKSAFKAKQYLNNGVPVLSSNIPENNSFIVDGRNGFLCSTLGEFRNRIIEINNMGHEEYRNFSEAALATIPAFNLEGYCNKLFAAYEAIP